METSVFIFTGCQIQEICLFVAITLLHKLQGKICLIFTREVEMSIFQANVHVPGWAGIYTSLKYTSVLKLQYMYILFPARYC